MNEGIFGDFEPVIENKIPRRMIPNFLIFHKCRDIAFFRAILPTSYSKGDNPENQPLK